MAVDRLRQIKRNEITSADLVGDKLVFKRWDGSTLEVSITGGELGVYLLRAQNLADILDAAEARSNLNVASTLEVSAAISQAIEGLSSNAEDISVTPAGENVDADVQAAIDTLFLRTRVTRAFDDLRVAYKMFIDDFQAPNTIADGIGDPAAYWNGVVATGGLISKVLPNTVRLSTGPSGDGGRAYIQALAHTLNGSPVWMQRWYVGRGGGNGANPNQTLLRLGNIHNGLTALGGAWFQVDLDGTFDVIAHVGDGVAEATPVDTGIDWANNAVHEFQIECDGAGNHFFYIDGDEVAVINTNSPSVFVACSPSVEVEKLGTGTNGIILDVDYVAMRVEAPR